MLPQRATIDFSWTPVADDPLTFTVGGNTYPYTHQEDAVTRASDVRYEAYPTFIGTELTFVATAVLPDTVVPIKWRWDFGDGTAAYGATVGHTYLVATPSAQVSARMLDNFGRSYSRHKVMNLQNLV